MSNELKRYNPDWEHVNWNATACLTEDANGTVVLHSDALAAIEAAKPKWLDIAGAPKDGTEVILRSGDRIGSSMWLAWLEEPTWAIGFDGDSWDGEKSPTHYQPLPQKASK